MSRLHHCHHFSRHPQRCPQLRQRRALRRPRRRGPPALGALEATRRAKRRGGHRAAAMARRAVRRAYGEWESPITATGWHEKLQVLWDYGDVMKDFGVWGRVFEYEVFGIRADFTKYHGEIYNHLMRI